MTAEQLEELQRLIKRAKDFADQAKGHDAPLFEAELLKMADSMDHLVRRVIAAEKLSKAVDAALTANGEWATVSVLNDAYREARK